MADPATGTVAATTTLATVTSGMAGLSAIMPASASFMEFVWGCAFAMLGTFCYQFIVAGAERQKAASTGVPINNRPQIDKTLLAYAMAGAPLSAALLIFAIHEFHGATGFGDGSFLLSVVGFMIAGPVGNLVVIKAVSAIAAFITSKFGSK